MPGNGLMTEVVAGTTTMSTTTLQSMRRTGMESQESGKQLLCFQFESSSLIKGVLSFSFNGKL